MLRLVLLIGVLASVMGFRYQRMQYMQGENFYNNFVACMQNDWPACTTDHNPNNVFNVWETDITDQSIYGMDASTGNAIIKVKQVFNTGQRSDLRSGRLVSKGTFDDNSLIIISLANIPMNNTRSTDLLWPAIWMEPQLGQWPTQGEIDIVEKIRDSPILSALHTSSEPSSSCQLPQSTNLRDMKGCIMNYDCTNCNVEFQTLPNNGRPRSGIFAMEWSYLKGISVYYFENENQIDTVYPNPDQWGDRLYAYYPFNKLCSKDKFARNKLRLIIDLKVCGGKDVDPGRVLCENRANYMKGLGTASAFSNPDYYWNIKYIKTYRQVPGDIPAFDIIADNYVQLTSSGKVYNWHDSQFAPYWQQYSASLVKAEIWTTELPVINFHNAVALYGEYFQAPIWSAAPSYTYLGCFNDQPSRALPINILNSPTLTPYICQERCRKEGYTYAATQYSTTCWCGNNVDYAKYGSDASRCDMPCGGDSGQICGGSFANSVYLTVPYTSEGCWMDQVPPLGNEDNRAMGPISLYLTDMTIDKCISHCYIRGFKYAGLQASSYCFCSHDTDNYKQYGATTGCTSLCSGNYATYCGGGWKNSVFKIAGQMAPVTSGYTIALVIETPATAGYVLQTYNLYGTAGPYVYYTGTTFEIRDPGLSSGYVINMNQVSVPNTHLNVIIGTSASSSTPWYPVRIGDMSGTTFNGVAEVKVYRSYDVPGLRDELVLKYNQRALVTNPCLP